MRHFGLAGFPLEHSFSPGYFNSKFKQKNITGCKYELYPVREAGQIRHLFETDPNLEGLNITIPWKQEVIKYLDILDDTAKEAGAVNVIRARRSGAGLLLEGFNTDVYGFIVSLPDDIKEDTDRALILGSGGASAAVACALRLLDISYYVVSRHPARDKIIYEELTAEMISGSKLIINTTPVGMFPDTEAKPPLDYDLLSHNNFLYDLVYNPAVTKFMEEGVRRGCRVMNGQNMLESQADRAWDIWNSTDL